MVSEPESMTAVIYRVEPVDILSEPESMTAVIG